jgi:hypothetical protein
LDSSGSGLEQVSDCCEHGDELTGSRKSWEYLECLSDCWLLKNSLEMGAELTNVVLPVLNSIYMNTSVLRTENLVTPLILDRRSCRNN